MAKEPCELFSCKLNDYGCTKDNPKEVGCYEERIEKKNDE